MKLVRLAVTGFLSIATGLLVAGCPNTGTAGSGTGSNLAAGTTPPIGSTPGSSTASGGGGSGGASTPVALNFTIISAVASGASGGSGAPTFVLDFNANNANNNLNNVCQVAQGGPAPTSGTSGQSNFNPSLSCLCNYTWGVTNQSSSQVVTRSIVTQPKAITAFEAECPGPGVYGDPNEMPIGTTLQINLIPNTAAGNNSGFKTNTISFTIQAVGQSGDFRDVEGDSFINVYHYTCYDIQVKSIGITQAVNTQGTNPLTNQPITSLTANQFDFSKTDFSGQSYYYDFYILANQPGNVSQNNGHYMCPTVNNGGIPSYYPMDSQFAVALQQSPKFPIALCGRTYLGATGGSGASGGGGAAGASGGGQAQQNICGQGSSPIGFAAKTNADGTCPAFTDTSGTLRPTYRIRQFTGIYPIRYNGDANVSDTSGQANNTVFVIDRPVDKASENPIKPITRLGPKPCPFSFSTVQFGQACSTNSALTGWNIDGTQVPGNPKCPIYPPLPQPNTTAAMNTQLSLAVKADGTLVIRPYKAFLTHYIENNSLQACAFQSTNAIDPPIVLSHDSSIFPNSNPADFYCANYYPQAGSIIPQQGNTFSKAPGACSTSDSAQAIKTDKSYACLETYNPSARGAQTPLAGCCQICSGTNCTGHGGGRTPAGRNAVFSPPLDPNQGTNPTQSIKLLPLTSPNRPGGGGCFDPDDDL